MLDAATAAISVSLALLIMVFLLSLVANKSAMPCCLVIRRWVQCGRSSIKYFFMTPFMKIEQSMLSTPISTIHADMWGRAGGAARQTRSRKIEFSFLNGNLIAPASASPI
jgi:hypothetical protein